jgi:tRNA(fMet)-specific endonuclease VapC
MIVLDTDHMSVLEWGGPNSFVLRERLADVPSHRVATSIVSYEEQVRGWMAYLARARNMEQEVEAYRRLRQHLHNYCEILILDFDGRAAAEFQRLRRARLRVGTMDLKIAAVVLANDATLLSRNMADFRKIPGLRVEDWTRRV